eukprot:CAMPEP_0203766130 /NCGR_PEP_ID=MMETSP0099_2-20121227/239_1 /ASSEMBLY_ACC=CAM_ASM_000209 /TAXON_ID=96639 /ORGANISM=" , Strain NY0313808BC1" /LENGTH=134 /DNA_ID=CAMNT_0050662431 /DNA_START=738 /DNA_END=1139 /DNA_ORIENTATION=+
MSFDPGDTAFSALSPAQHDAIQIVIKLGASFSVLGDLVILHGCFRHGFDKWTTYHRILVLMSLFDILSSVFYGIGDRAVPPPFGDGTQAFCNTQGFFQQIGLAVPMLNATLAANYLAVIKYEWSHDKVKKLEPW